MTESQIVPKIKNADCVVFALPLQFRNGELQGFAFPKELQPFLHELITASIILASGKQRRLPHPGQFIKAQSFFQRRGESFILQTVFPFGLCGETELLPLGYVEILKKFPVRIIHSAASILSRNDAGVIPVSFLKIE